MWKATGMRQEKPGPCFESINFLGWEADRVVVVMNFRSGNGFLEMLSWAGFAFCVTMIKTIMMIL